MKKYYYSQTVKLRKIIFICSALIFFFGLGMWNSLSYFMKWIIGVSLIIRVYDVIISYFTVVYFDEEGLKVAFSPSLRKFVFLWNDIESIVMYSYFRERPVWIVRKIYNYPVFSVWIYSSKRKHLCISSWIENYEELMEKFLEEFDKRGLGGKVDYRVREKLWEIQDAKREEEEWEEWKDEEWEEEEDE